MSASFKISSDPTPRGLRILLALIVVTTVGGMGTTLTRLFVGSISYTTKSLSDVWVHEFIYSIKPYLIGLVPVLCIGLKLVFQRTAFIKLQIISLLIGLLLGLPSYINTMSYWMPMQRILQDLPVENVTYHRHTGRLGYSGQTWINFTIPKDVFDKVHPIIQERSKRRNPLQSYKPAVSYYDVTMRTIDGKSLSPSYYDITQFEGVIEGTLRL